MQYTLGFIGCGNMGGALAKAASKSLQGNQIALCDFDKAKVEKYVQEFGAVAVTTQEIAREARFVVLAVKPQMMENAIAEFAEILRARTDVTIITMAAGLSMAAIRQYIGADLPIIRIMPNTPAMLGLGMILYATEQVNQVEEKAFLDAFKAAGAFDKIPEADIDAGSVVSGCGPAFVYAFIQALADGGVACGVDKDKALFYAAQTAKGAAEMLLQFGDSQTLIKNVCSPGGTTIEGVKTLENENLNGVVADAVKASYKRTLELKK
jgi:pyrroline-5-carboxylate reductase